MAGLGKRKERREGVGQLRAPGTSLWRFRSRRDPPGKARRAPPEEGSPENEEGETDGDCHTSAVRRGRRLRSVRGACS